jgi:hypothetical protein
MLQNAACRYIGNYMLRRPKHSKIEVVEPKEEKEERMSLQLHFLYSLLDSFPQNLGEVSDEHSGRFHHDISIMEKQFVERWKCGMLAECCWSIVRETPEGGYKRKRSRKTF